MSQGKDQAGEDLLPQRVDRLTRLARGLTGAVPVVGSMLAEIVGSVIPNQRIDRITDTIIRLGQKVASLEEEVLRERLESSDFVDLFEDGMIQAARSVSDERREHITTILKNSLTREDLEHLEKKKLIELLGRLNDAELIILRSYGLRPDLREDFYQRHEDVLYGVRAHLGSSQEELDRAAVQGSYRQQLRDLGLIEPRFRRPRRGELPEFDVKTGMMKAQGDQLTGLGRLLLRYLDLEVEW